MKRVLPILAAVLIVVAFIPMDHTVSKNWNVTVADELGKPVGGVRVTEVWQNYSLEKASHQEEVATHVDGTAFFPKRTIPSSFAQRLLGCLGQVGLTGFHTSCGDSSEVMVERKHDYVSLDEATYDIREGRGHDRIFATSKTSHLIYRK